jgi:hypothetical protein
MAFWIHDVQRLPINLPGHAGFRPSRPAPPPGHPSRRCRPFAALGLALIAIASASALLATRGMAATPPGGEPAPAWDRPLPLGAQWAVERGIELPNPFGVGMFVVYMSRDFEVDDVRVTLPGDEPVSISDVASFDVRNYTMLAALKFDAWILPVLNVYGLVGHTWTDTRLDATITLDPIIGGPIVFGVTQDSEVGGPMIGAGATAVAGSGPWFVMADANFAYSDIEVFDNGIAAWFLSARTGWSGTAAPGVWRAWVGAAYLAAARTLTISETAGSLGTVVVEVDQRPVDPVTYQFGGSLGFGRRWETMLELGSNFDDAFVGVLSAAYRF